MDDNYTSEQKKSGLRKKLKSLEGQLSQYQSLNGSVMREQVEKTQNLLKMYELDSPVIKQHNGIALRSRDGS